MRTKEIKLYKFIELSDEAKEKAISDYREGSQEIFWQSETFDSLKALFETAGITLKDYSLGLDRSYIKIDMDDNAKELTGARALGWLENNLLCKLRCTRADYLKNRKNYFSWGYRIGKIKDCPLTGYCSDEDFLEALVDNVKSGMDLEDSFKSLADTYQKIIEDEYNHQNSDEYISETLESDYCEFLENGEVA